MANNIKEISPDLARLTGWALNIAIALQIIVGALITAIAALVSGHSVRAVGHILVLGPVFPL